MPSTPRRSARITGRRTCSGQNALAPGGSVTITIKDGRRACKYDMRFEFQGDDLDDLEDTQDLCQMSDYTITE